MRALVFGLGLLGPLGCGTEATSTAVFPTSYASTYQEVRNCRYSIEHSLVNIRVLASPDAVEAYQGRLAPFPAGAIALKEEYAESDTSCAGPIQGFTVMQKLPVGSSPATLDWQWQRTSSDRVVTSENEHTCIACHTNCGQPPDGYDGTCTVPSSAVR